MYSSSQYGVLSSRIAVPHARDHLFDMERRNATITSTSVSSVRNAHSTYADRGVSVANARPNVCAAIGKYLYG
jgi:hypothetical protein